MVIQKDILRSIILRLFTWEMYKDEKVEDEYIEAAGGVDEKRASKQSMRYSVN